MSKRHPIFPSVKETYIQQSFIKWLSWQYPRVHKVTASFANAGKRSIMNGKRMKAEGMKEGMLDTGIFYRTKRYAGLFIEFKSENGVLRPKQKEMIELLTEQGYHCAVCRSLEEGMQIIKEYLSDQFNPVT